VELLRAQTPEKRLAAGHMLQLKGFASPVQSYVLEVA
jgi:hypothetical protein